MVRQRKTKYLDAAVIFKCAKEFCDKELPRKMFYHEE
jgi:hypothetical protein